MTFGVGDSGTMSFERPFDAVVGRLFLSTSLIPSDAPSARSSTQTGRHGSFSRVDLQSAASVPESPLFAQAMKWANAALVGTGADDRMGLKLYSSFMAAGLPALA